MNSKVIRLKNGNFVEILSDAHIDAKSEFKYMAARKCGKSIISMKNFVDRYCPDDLTDGEKAMIYKRFYRGE